MAWQENYPQQNNLAKLALTRGGQLKPLLIPALETNGTGLCNPSILVDTDGEILVNIRHVNYVLFHSEFEQKFCGLWGYLQYLNPEDYVYLQTQNYLCHLDSDFNIHKYDRVDTTRLDQKTQWEFIGLEDARLVRWEDKLYLAGVRRDTTPNGQGRIELSYVKYHQSGTPRELSRSRIEPPENTYLEKNWMPILDLPFHFVRWCAPLEVVKCDPQSLQSETISIEQASVPVKDTESEFRGGTQVVKIGRQRLCIIHECFFPPRLMGNKKDAHYYHRFVFFDLDWKISKISHRFKFMDAMIEFATGLAVYQDHLLVTFGFQDNAAYLLTLPLEVLDELTYE